ncbi:signal peptide peptidase SppA [Rubritalea tangerina]|uniref:Signal peptide peptidase SppA n=2 Tax=Rubritalea tangerina TaxID=430798 RepID=A0ABW4ZFJ9_9BACT
MIRNTALISALICSPLLAAPTVAVYDLDAPVTESGTQASNPFLLDSPERPLTHFDIIRSLNQALTDDEVPAVVLDIDGAQLSLAQAQEIRALLQQLRAANKDVWVYTEYLTPISALIGSAANHMTLMPAGDVQLQGLYGESLYFKNLLDKVGVKVEVVHIGDFKSAGETFYRESPSEYAKKQEDALLDSVFSQIVEQISEGRKIPPAKMKEIIDLGSITPQQALEFKLVDHLEYRTNFINNLRELHEDETKFDDSYALPDLNGPEITGFFDMMKILMSAGKEKKLNSPYIAVVPLEGTITDESIAKARLEILKATRNTHCKGLVLRVNSPGGSALASDVLWEATSQFKKTKRPFVVSMGGVAASGGYYISAAADEIYAEPGTITGSIGVVGMKLVMGDALDKLGINVHASKRGKHADILNSTRPYTDQERAMIKQSMLEVYANFKQRIVDGRGDKLKGQLEKLAGGRVYSGADAKSVGLVDKLGGLQDAISRTVELSEAKDAKILMLPEPKNPFDGLFAVPEKDEHEFISAAPTRSLQSISLSSSDLLTKELRQMLPLSLSQQLHEFSKQLKSIQKDQIQLLSPALPKL